MENNRRMAGLVAALMIGVCPGGPAVGGDVWETIRGDYAEFYSGESLLKLGGGLVVGGLAANTSMDEDARDWWQDDVRSSGSDDMAKAVKPFGDGLLTVPVLAGAALLGLWEADAPALGTAGEWGRQSLRSMVVGVPPLLVLQNVLGSGRPRDGADSEWVPFDDNNGVSGHAFMGAAPFLVAANMSDHWGARAGWYAASAVCGLSRINDDDHYLSQVMVGWWLAYLSAEAVDRNRPRDRRVHWGAFVEGEYAGMDLRIAF